MKHSDDLLFIFHTQRGDDTGVECPGLNDTNSNVFFLLEGIFGIPMW